MLEKPGVCFREEVTGVRVRGPRAGDPEALHLNYGLWEVIATSECREVIRHGIGSTFLSWVDRTGKSLGLESQVERLSK